MDVMREWVVEGFNVGFKLSFLLRRVHGALALAEYKSREKNERKSGHVKVVRE